MNVDVRPEVLVRTRDRLEILVVGIGIAVPAFVIFSQKYWLFSYVTRADAFFFLFIVLGLPLGPVFVWTMHLRKKLKTSLRAEYKNDLLGEIRALQTLNDPIAWGVFKRKSKAMFLGEFLLAGQICLAYLTFAYYA
jgi:hypothetical protein